MGIRPKNRIWHTFKTIFEVTGWIEMLESYLRDFPPHSDRAYDCAQKLMDIRADWKAGHFKDLPCCLPDTRCKSCSYRDVYDYGDY